MTLRLTLGLISAALMWGQAPPNVPFPSVTLSPPGTAPLDPVLLTNLPVGFAQQVVASFSQRCTSTPIENQSPASECVVLSGDSRLLIRQGTRLTPNGNSLLAKELTATQNTGQLGLLITGIDVLDESNRLSPVIRTFASLDDPRVGCVTASADQVERTVRNIVTFTFNEPLNTLYVLTIHSKAHYQLAPGSTQVESSCVSPVVAASSGLPVVEDSTRTLIRVSGPFDDGSVLSSLARSATDPAGQ